MRSTLFALCLSVPALAATAQQLIPIPAFARTYSYSGHTRGFYCQAPAGFTVVGLRVPDETNHGLQNVALYKLTAKPPAFSATTTAGLQFFQAAAPSSLVLPTSVSYNAGDWLCVLGACGDSAMLHNSYGSVGFVSTIMGSPTTMNRLITQTNIVQNSGVAPYATDDTGPIARVEVYISTVSIQGSGSGAVGTAMVFGLNAPNDAGLPYQVASSLGNGPTPIGQRSLGLTLDSLFAASVSNNLPTVFSGYTGAVGASGRASATLNIPPFAVLKGVKIHSAFVTFKASAPLGVESISNTYAFTIT